MALESPKPTAPPDLRLFARRLQERSATFGAPTTCGYVSGNVSNPATCSSDYFCYSNTAQRVHGCCLDLDGCIAPTTCIDSTAVVTDCNNICLGDYSTLKCSLSNSYCYTQTWPDGFLQFGCATTNFAESVALTYTNQGRLATGAAATSSATSGGVEGTSPAGSSTTSSSSGISLSTGAITGITVGGITIFFLLVLWLQKCMRPSTPPRPVNPPPIMPPKIQDQPNWPAPVYGSPIPLRNWPQPLTERNLRSTEIRPSDSLSQIGDSEISRPPPYYARTVFSDHSSAPPIPPPL